MRRVRAVARAWTSDELAEIEGALLDIVYLQLYSSPEVCAQS